MATRRTHVMLTLFRCGETHWEDQGRLHGAADLPLSAAGRASVSTDAARIEGLRIATIYHPPDEASVETASIIADAARARRREVPELAAPSLGLLEGLLRQDVAERYPKRHKQWSEDPLRIIPPEGEPFDEARARQFAATAKILRKSRAEEIGIVMHRLGFGFLRCWLADRPARGVWRMVEKGPRVVRYAMSTALVDRLREASRAETVES